MVLKEKELLQIDERYICNLLDKDPEAIDGLVDYQLETIPDATMVVNPDYRELDSQIRSTNGKLSRRLAKFGSMNLEFEIEPEKVEDFEGKKAALRLIRRMLTN